MTKNKLHLAFSVLFGLGLVFLNFLPTILKATDDVQTFSVEGGVIWNISKNGALSLSSAGFRNDKGLFVEKVDFINLAVSCPSAISKFEFSIATTASSTPNNGLRGGSTNYSETTFVNLGQPNVPRNIGITVVGASGSVVIVGTDSFNRPQTETIFITSGVLNKGTIPFIGISSLTVTITTTSTDISSATFYLGYSTSVGLPFNIENASDVFRITESGVARTTFTVNAINNTVSISTHSMDGIHNYSIWAIVKKSIFFSDP